MTGDRQINGHHEFGCRCARCGAFSPMHFAFDEIVSAARLAKVVRDNGLIVVRGAVYGVEGRTACVTIATHTQALAALRDKDAIIEAQAAEIAALRAQLSSPRARGEGRGEGQPDEDFGGELIDAGDR